MTTPSELTLFLSGKLLEKVRLRLHVGGLLADLDGTAFVYDCWYATFVARAARVKQRSYTTRHSKG